MLVVRVKRNREDDPAETLCLVENNNSIAKDNEVQGRKKKVKLSGLSLSNREENKPLKAEGGLNSATNAISSHLILKRISTIDNQVSKQTLDSETMGLLSKRSELPSNEDAANEDSSSTNPRKRAKVIITQSKRAVPRDGKESCIIVDMMQVYHKPTPDTISEPTKNSGASKSTVTTKILDPATRELKQGILTAIQKNDFNGISSALIRGASPDYQLELKDGGYTALMAASLKGNLRMVKRLLLNQVNVLAVNKDGMTAIDLLPINNPAGSLNGSKIRNQKDYEEIRLELQNAILRSHQSPHKQQLKSQFDSLNQSTTTQLSDDYVIDVYCIDPNTANFLRQEQLKVHQSENLPESTSVNNQNDSETRQEPHSATLFPQNASLIQIEGLKIMEDGNVELFAYDSDWSDLADDEDPDSNDERYFANDYPDEEDDEMKRRGRQDDDEDYDVSEEEDDNYYRRQLQKRHSPLSNPYLRKKAAEKPVGTKERKVHFTSKKKPQSVRKNGEEEEDDEDEENGSNEEFDDEHDMEEDRLNIENEIDAMIESQLLSSSTGNPENQRENVFDRQSSIGKVFRSHLMNDNNHLMMNDGEAAGNNMRPDSESLRQLWQEDGEMEMEGNNNNNSTVILPQQERIQQMRQRTGMLFASNPREFDESGLAKYGQELSEEENEDEYIYQNANTARKPPKDTVAYDPEFDDQSGDEMMITGTTANRQ
jgi:hypothetical protein